MPIPKTLVAGDTWAWTVSINDYPATIYTLKYSLRSMGLTAIDITATADEADHLISVPASTTSGYAEGNYNWSSYVEKGAGLTLERYTVDSGTVKIKPAIFSATSASDLRSHAQVVLDAIEATIAGQATKSQSVIVVNGKQIQYIKLSELIQLRSIYRREVAGERGEGGTIRYSFGRG